MCPYKAINFDDEKSISIVNEAICRGCGTCAATCAGGAASAKHFTDEQINAEIVVNVQGDEPFTQRGPLLNLLEVFKNDSKKQIDVATLMIKMDVESEINNPNNVKVVVDEQNFAMYFSRSPIPFPREKSIAIYFKHIGIYAFRKEALLKFSRLPMNSLEAAEKLENLRFLANGLRVKLVETKEIAIGIDTPEDLEKANEIFKNR